MFKHTPTISTAFQFHSFHNTAAKC